MSYPFNHLNGLNGDQTVKLVVEIPKNSSHKIEWDRRAGYFVLDRVEPHIFSKPVNYGFIPQTLDEDGDELDALLITDEPLSTGIVVDRALVLGMLEFIDGGENDHKIICVPADDRHSRPLRRLEDLSLIWRQQSPITSSIIRILNKRRRLKLKIFCQQLRLGR